MTREPRTDRPRMFGGHLEPVRLPWSWALERLVVARNYWIATTRPRGRPHSRPVWGVWVEDAFYFSTGSLAAENLGGNREITVAELSPAHSWCATGCQVSQTYANRPFGGPGMGD